MTSERNPDQAPPPAPFKAMGKLWLSGFSSTIVFVALIPLVAITLVAAIYTLIQNTMDKAVRNDAAIAAQSWATYFAKNMEGLDAILDGNSPTASQKAFVASARDMGQVFRFKLFDKQGRLVLISDEDGAIPNPASGLDDHSEEAVRSIAEGRTLVSVVDNKTNQRLPSLYAEAYVPVSRGDAKSIGAVEVYVDQTTTMALFKETFFGLTLTLVAMIMLVFLVPAVAFVARNNQALKSAGAAAAAEVSARQTAEAQARELGEVNDKITALNREMANNLRMLHEAQEQLVSKGRLSQLGQLTATVAHELRNPLGAVRTSAFLLERKIKGKGLGVETQLERIANGITRCDDIISQLLDFARTKSLQTEVLNLDDWLVKLIEEEAQRLPASVAIECQLGLGGTQIVFDPARMARVVINLVTNAAEALVGKADTPAKGARKPPVITISTRLAPRGVEIAVSDNGPGIASDSVERIFEPLFTTKSFGTGLGLPAAQKVLEQHDGGLELHSIPGQDTTFTAWWPKTAKCKEAA